MGFCGLIDQKGGEPQCADEQESYAATASGDLSVQLMIATRGDEA
jgi:hypothetical protein